MDDDGPRDRLDILGISPLHVWKKWQYIHGVDVRYSRNRTADSSTAHVDVCGGSLPPKYSVSIGRSAFDQYAGGN